MASTKLPTFEEARKARGLSRSDVQRESLRLDRKQGKGRSYKSIWAVETMQVTPTGDTRKLLAKTIGADPAEIEWERSDDLDDAIAQAVALEQRIRPLLPDPKLVAALTRTIEHAEARAGD